MSKYKIWRNQVYGEFGECDTHRALNNRYICRILSIRYWRDIKLLSKFDALVYKIIVLQELSKRIEVIDYEEGQITAERGGGIDLVDDFDMYPF